MAGAPRRQPFTYSGGAFPELTGRRFPSVAAFCREAKISPSMVYGRVHGGWSLMKALDTPKVDVGERSGVVYKVTRMRTGEKYVGLTVQSLTSRWAYHVRSAVRRSSPLANAIREDGSDGFLVEVIEANVVRHELADRERYWIAKLNTLAPNGLNKHPGGATGGGGQRPVEHDGERFVSVIQASEFLASRHNLTPAAAHQRLRKGKPLAAPLKVRRTHGKRVSGSFLWSRWRAMRNNQHSELGTEWQEWDRFASDLAHLKRSDRLVRLDTSRPWGPENYAIHPGSFIDHPKVGTLHWTRWRSLLKSSDRPDGRGLMEEWRDFDTFEHDVARTYFERAVLIPIEWSKPWGPSNFRWGTQTELSRMVGRHGRKALKHGEHATRTYKRWASMHNDARQSGCGVASEWHNYLIFRDAVGEAIERGLVLVRPDRSAPWGPQNCKTVSRREYLSMPRALTHGATNTPLYRRWSSLRSRAQKEPKGCDPRWDLFEGFAADIGEDRPDCDLRRVDPSLPYGPGNVVWVSRVERKADADARKRAKRDAAQVAREAQRVSVRDVTYRGLYALARAYGLPASTVCLRVRNGMTPEEAVLIPNKNMAVAQPVTLDGQQFRSKSAALAYVEERYGIQRSTMQFRLKSGLTLEEAARKPLGRNGKTRRR